MDWSPPRSPTATPEPVTPTSTPTWRSPNKVQTRDGKWLALDGQPLHRMVAAASEQYNARLEAQQTRDALGGPGSPKRPNPDAPQATGARDRRHRRRPE